MPLAAVRHFFKQDAAVGVLLGIAALLALILENSPLEYLYNQLLTTPLAIKVGAFELYKPLLLWINDGLMAVFFLLVGLEIKREFLEGHLASRDQIALPAIAALGGLALPAILYTAINSTGAGDPAALKGWAIPSATDIAFALGVVTLLGNRVPANLKLTLLAIAVLDDLAAIVIIALFYTENLSLVSLGLAAAAILALLVLNSLRVTSRAPYIIIGVLLWTFVLKSGVHATLAGVVLAFFIPLRTTDAEGKSPLIELEHGLAPWVSFGVLPLFAFANAGVSLSGLSLDSFLDPITLGIIAGLVIGKQVGVFGATWLGIKLRLCRLPDGVNWQQYYGLALVTGIGFTMSLFIGTLAFDDVSHQSAVRLGVLAGSLVSGIAGYVVLKATTRRAEASS